MDGPDLCHLCLVLFELLVEVADPPLGGHPHHPPRQPVPVPAPGPLLLPVEREDQQGRGGDRGEAEQTDQGDGEAAGPCRGLLRPEGLEPGIEVRTGRAGKVCCRQLTDHIHGLA